jgi:hypothetical protein
MINKDTGYRVPVAGYRVPVTGYPETGKPVTDYQDLLDICITYRTLKN